MIFTIGHSTRTAEAFVGLIHAHGIAQIADVRIFPHSRRLPHFNGDALAALLHDRGIGYAHFPELGGRRAPRADSRNTAWREAGFRGYADYMATPAFEQGLERLVGFVAIAATAIMCAEAVWWQCHRRLLSDALVVRGVTVYHVLSCAVPKPHELSGFARIEGTAITYPGLLSS